MPLDSTWDDESNGVFETQLRTGSTLTEKLLPSEIALPSVLGAAITGATMITIQDSIEHITLDTGHANLSPLKAATPDVIDLIRTSLAHNDGHLANTGWQVRMGDLPGLMPGLVQSWNYALYYQDTWMAACTLCACAADHSNLWAIIENACPHDLSGNPIRKPQYVPWLAVSIMRDAILCHRDKLGQAGDLERCVAWALLTSPRSVSLPTGGGKSKLH